jgi:hypothetical protein
VHNDLELGRVAMEGSCIHRNIVAQAALKRKVARAQIGANFRVLHEFRRCRHDGLFAMAASSSFPYINAPLSGKKSRFSVLPSPAVPFIIRTI